MLIRKTSFEMMVVMESGERMCNVLIVLNYNDAATTSSFLEFAQLYRVIDKIVVVDNCSTDDSLKVLSQYSNSKIDVISTKKNGGYGYGNNFGAKYAISKYRPDIIFFSNPDVFFEEKVVEKMQSFLTQNNDVGIVTPLVNQGYNVWPIPNYFGILEQLLLVSFNIEKAIIRTNIERNENNYCLVGVVEGSFFAIKASVFEKVNGFDEKTFLYGEENILAYKLKEKGFREAALCDSYYDHFHSVTIKKVFKSKIKTYKYCRAGMLVYLNDYLKVNKIQKCIFNLVFIVGYVERILYEGLRSFGVEKNN